MSPYPKGMLRDGHRSDIDQQGAQTSQGAIRCGCACHDGPGGGRHACLHCAAGTRELSLRRVRRLLRAYRLQGAAALAHGNRGLPSPRHIAQAIRDKVLAMALGGRAVAEGLLHHSDQGTQYTRNAYQGRLADLKARVSMSGVGNCYDNAVRESFFGMLKAECATHRFATREEARRAIFEFTPSRCSCGIGIWYNRQRLRSSLGYFSPAEYERRLTSDTISVH